MLRTLLGVIAGVIVALAVVMGSQAGIHLIYPPPPGDYMDPAVAKAAMAQAPAVSLVLVTVGYGLAALIGALVATGIARRKGWPGWIIGGLLILATAMNLAMLPHPIWFGPLAVVLIGAGTWFGSKGLRKA